MCKILEKEPEPNRITPFSGNDFLTFLSKNDALHEADRYMYRIRDLLKRLSDANILTEVGHSNNPLLGGEYYFLKELTNRERADHIWLSSALGPEYIHYIYSPITIQVTGVWIDEEGYKKPDAGTALILNENWLVTCAHVLTDMEVDKEQKINGDTYTVIDILPHKTIDIGLIRIKDKMHCNNNIIFSTPILSETIYTLGYPRIPQASESPIIMNKGEIINPSISTFNNTKLFLYSAITHPGNSGGPIISSTGNIVGIVTGEVISNSKEIILPFYAGVPTEEIIKAISELNTAVSIPVEDYR